MLAGCKSIQRLVSYNAAIMFKFSKRNVVELLLKEYADEDANTTVSADEIRIKDVIKGTYF